MRFQLRNQVNKNMFLLYNIIRKFSTEKNFVKTNVEILGKA